VGIGIHGNRNGITQQRRRLVSSIIIRRPAITRRELHKLVSEKIKNPYSDKPFVLSTIQNDIAAIKRRWQERIDQNVEAWMAELFATLDELQGDAWGKSEYAIVVRCIQERAKLRGIYAPARVEVSWKEELQRAGIDEASAGDLFEKLVQEYANELADEAAAVTGGEATTPD